MACNDSYSAPRKPYNECIEVRIYRNILFKRNELVGACRVHRGLWKFRGRRYYKGRGICVIERVLGRGYIYIYIYR